MATLTDPDPTDPLVAPSHATLHTAVNAEIRSLTGRIDALAAKGPQTELDIRQARMAAHEWVVRGPVSGSGVTMLPVLWNITGRVVEFTGAKLTVLSPATGGDIVVDIKMGTTLGAGADQTSILNTPLMIPAGQYFSATLNEDAFPGVHAMNSYLVASYTSSASTPGADLTVQLNRLL